jgi:hypothetical protein
MHRLAAGLLDRAQRDEGAIGLEAGFFLEFSPSRLERILFRFELALRQRPRPLVLARPERSTRMNQEDLQGLVPGPAEREETGALDRPYPGEKGRREATGERLLAFPLSPCFSYLLNRK